MAGKKDFRITTPRGSVFTVTGKDGSVTAKLEWAPGFAQKKAEGFSRAQQKQMHWTANTISICQTRIQRSSSRIRSHSQMETVSREGTTRNSMVKENIPIPEGKRDEYFI